MVVDTAHQLYYVNVVDLVLKDPYQLEILSNKVMDVVRKEHIISFHKWLPICDLSLGLKFMQ
jgi:hypothetical protein